MQEESPLLGNTRRTVLKQFAAVAVVNAIPLAGRDAPSADAGVPGAAQSEEVILEDSELRAAFDPVSGALTALEYKPTGWAIELRPELGASFWMYVPLPDRRDNFILGHKQRAKRVKKAAIRYTWSGTTWSANAPVCCRSVLRPRLRCGMGN